MKAVVDGEVNRGRRYRRLHVLEYHRSKTEIGNKLAPFDLLWFREISFEVDVLLRDELSLLVRFHRSKYANGGELGHTPTHRSAMLTVVFAVRKDVDHPNMPYHVGFRKQVFPIDVKIVCE